MHHPAWNNDHWTVLQHFPALARSTSEISPCVPAMLEKQSATWNLWLAWRVSVGVKEAPSGVKGGGGGEGGTRCPLAVCFSRKWLFVSFSTEGLLRVRRASLQIRETDSVAIHSSDNLKAVWHSLHGHRWFAVVKTPWLYTRLHTDTHWKWITVHCERLWWSENCRAPFTVKFIVLLQAEQGGLSIVVQILNLIRFVELCNCCFSII